MLKYIHNLLNKITMYRLTLYVLLFFVFAAEIISFFGKLPFSSFALLYSTIVFLISCWVVNVCIAWLLDLQVNVESAYITALILALIVSPPQSGHFINILPFLLWASFWAIASKFIVNIFGKHIFNPAAIAVVITSFFLQESASWWVGSASMLPFVLVGGALIVTKIRRWDAMLSFALSAIVIVLLLSNGAPTDVLDQIITSSPLIFLGTIMLTEPITMPPTRDTRIAYGILVGLLFSPQAHLGSFYFTPELALLVGNAFSYLVSSKRRFTLELVDKKEIGLNIYEFVFKAVNVLNFKPGQYMEWTISPAHADGRGNRRYFTLASSPTEPYIKLGVKFYPNSSTFKKQMLQMKAGDRIQAGQLSGDFTLPSDKKQEIVCIAGGVGITPFRSMMQYLLDNNSARPVELIYASKSKDELVYGDILDQAEQKLGIKTHYILSDEPSKEWTGYRGRITTEFLQSLYPNIQKKEFFISGPPLMVDDIKKELKKLGVSRSKIKTDYFPGLA